MASKLNPCLVNDVTDLLTGFSLRGSALFLNKCISITHTGFISALNTERLREAVKQKDAVQLEASLFAARRAGIIDTALLQHAERTLNIVQAREGESTRVKMET